MSGANGVRASGPVVRNDSSCIEIERLLLSHKLVVAKLVQDGDGFFVQLRGRRGLACGLQPSMAAAYAEAIEEYLEIENRRRPLVGKENTLWRSRGSSLR